MLQKLNLNNLNFLLYQNFNTFLLPEALGKEENTNNNMIKFIAAEIIENKAGLKPSNSVKYWDNSHEMHHESGQRKKELLKSHPIIIHQNQIIANKKLVFLIILLVFFGKSRFTGRGMMDMNEEHNKTRTTPKSND